MVERKHHSVAIPTFVCTEPFQAGETVTLGEDEAHPLASLMDVLSALIENYENANVPELALMNT